jgi:dTMP kinase
MTTPFITIEGIDGCGKSTLIENLKKALGTTDILFTREPFEAGLRTEIYAAIKKDFSPMAILFMFLADRAEHIDHVIKPALTKNIPVISDRYMDSTIAYQGTTLKNRFGSNSLSVLKELHRQWVLTPSLTILLDMDESVALKRLCKRSDGYIDEYETAEYLHSIRKNFLSLVADDPDRFKIVNADQSPDAVLKDVLNILSVRYPSITIEQ